MRILKKVILFISVLIAASCIDPYYPDITDYKSLLVVAGQLTNENKATEIRLSRTFQDAGVLPELVDDATVSILDQEEGFTMLRNIGNGRYKTDSTLFTAKTGHKYSLVIITADGKEYHSDECVMLPVAGIDSLYFEDGEEVSGVSGELHQGLKVLLNTSGTEGMSEYYRWSFEEVWKVEMPFPQQYTYSYVSPLSVNFTPLPVFANVCWKRKLSSSININSNIKGGSGKSLKQEINFIASMKSDRLTDEYSILVKQYSISKREFEFWNNLKNVGEPDADIFSSQPYAVVGNVFNINDPDELVLGYFGVSSVKQKRIFITAEELDKHKLPHYVTECEEIRKSPEDFPSIPPPTWDEIYHGYTDLHDYIFVKPEVIEGTVIAGNIDISSLVKLVFTTRECAVCEDQGYVTEPDFWIEKN